MSFTHDKKRCAKRDSLIINYSLFIAFILMRTTQFLLTTSRETPAETEIVSHQLMLRSGMIRKIASGIYAWLPLGWRVLKKVENIVRDEMDKTGALEMLMPAVQPAELWRETGRWETFGGQLLKIRDRNEHEFCFGPTHEEIITALVRHEIRSYKQLPVTFYQIQTKFRDEIRPRFGVMRAREFLMKDAYSFHLDEKSLDETYEKMYTAYSNIFKKIGLKFRAVSADTGAMGGNASHEFHVLANSGEDLIAFSDESDYAANVEIAETLAPALPISSNNKIQTVETPNQRTIEEVSNFLKIPSSKICKTLILKGKDFAWYAIVLRGDHELNEFKLAKLPQIETPVTFATPEEVEKIIGCAIGSIGPVGLKIPIIADRDAIISDFVCGANQEGKHLVNVNWERDLPLPQIADIRKVVVGDLSPDGKGKLNFARGIEVGHIFKLGTKYSVAMKATVLNATGKAVAPIMGCYGIGVSRIVASSIEQNYDTNGIIWPEAIAPFQIALVPISFHQSYRVRELAEKLYTDLTAAGFEVLFDDRKERAGVLFADMDLIGIPHRIVISESNIDAGVVEYKARNSTTAEKIGIDKIKEILNSKF